MRFPQARILRIDSDAAQARGRLETLLDQAREADILVGTQIMAKGHHLERLEVPRATDVADDREVAQAFQAAAEPRLVRAHVVEHVLAVEDVEVGQRNRATHRMPTERDAMGERGPMFEKRLGEELATDHRAEGRVPAREALGTRDDVGQVVVALAAEHRAEPAERADHLVGHEQHAVPVADLPHAREVAVGWNQTAARVLYRLQEHRGDRLRSFEDDALLDLVGDREHERLFIVLEVVSPTVGVGDVHCARRERFERCAQRGDARDGERAKGGAVVGGAARDHLVPLALADGAEILAGQLPRRLHRLRPTTGEEHSRQVAGGERGQAGRELDGGRVGVRPDREVLEGLGLRARRLRQIGAAVPDLHGEQTRQAVEQAVTGGVPHVRTGPARDDVDGRIVAVAAEA